MWFIGVEVEQETSAPPPKKNPGSAPELIKLTTVSEEINTLSITKSEGSFHIMQVLPRQIFVFPTII